MWVATYARATCKTKRCQFCNNCNISVITGSIALKLDMWVGTYQTMHAHVSLGLWCSCTRARAVVASRFHE